MIDVVEEWLDQTGVRPSLEAIDESERILRVDVDGQQSVNLGDGLWDWTLELRSTGAVELEVDPGSAFRRGKIRIHVTEGLRTVRFVAPAGLAQVIIVGTTRDDECEIEMVGCRVLGAESIALSVLSAEAESLFARDAEIRFWDDFEVSAFFPEGSVRLGGTASVTAESTWLRDEARLSCAESQFHLGTVYWQSEPPQELSIEAGRVHAVTLDNPVSDNRIRIADGARFDVETVRGHLTMPATTFVCGGGTLGISGHGTAITFEADGDLHLDLGDGASVEGATGSVGVSLGSGASLQGDLQSPLVITSLSAAAGTGLTAIDLSALRYQDLGSLETVERLVPTLPTWLPSARKVADARIPRDPGIIMKPFALAEAAHFWTRISAIMTARSARGASQSAARYLSARARRQAAPLLDRERIVLTFYAVVGYGESMLRPALLFFLTSVLAAILASSGSFSEVPAADSFGAALWQALTAPVAFFRGRGGTTEPEHGAITVAGLVGLVAFLFFLLAARRISRAE